MIKDTPKSIGIYSWKNIQVMKYSIQQESNNYRFFVNIPPCLDMTQGRFNVGGGYEPKLTCAADFKKTKSPVSILS